MVKTFQNGKLVNCAFGANVPYLIELILKELDIERRTRDTDPETSGRIYYDLNEMTPVERERFDAIQKFDEENDRIEEESSQRRRIEYLTFITDEIMKNASDMGVTILMPHVISRDLLKRLTDPADKCHLVAKDKKNVQVLREHIDMLEFCTSDLMSQYLIDHILNRDVFVVCWKVTDTNIDNEKNVEGLYQIYKRNCVLKKKVNQFVDFFFLFQNILGIFCILYGMKKRHQTGILRYSKHFL